MIDTDKYKDTVYIVTMFLEDNEQYGDDWSKEKKELNDLLAEVIRLRGIAKTCLEAIEAGGDIRSGTIELIEHNLKGMIE